MPTPSKDRPWYSIEQASVHFTVISTEHDWWVNSEQVINFNKLNLLTNLLIYIYISSFVLV